MIMDTLTVLLFRSCAYETSGSKNFQAYSMSININSYQGVPVHHQHIALGLDQHPNHKIQVSENH